MLADLFDVPKGKDALRPGQRNWLELVSRIPQLKILMGDPVRPEDQALAHEAAGILKESS